MRRRLLDSFLGVALLALVPLPLRADPAPAVAAPAAPLTVTRPEDRMARRTARRAAMLDAELDAVHAGLQLSAGQDKMWPPVVAAMRGLDEARGFRFRQTLAAAANQVDALKLQGDHMAAMGAAMGRLADATRPLVASLTPDQKSRLPSLLQRMRPRKIVSRAFDLPQDDGSTGTGQGGQGTGGQQAAPVAPRAAPAAGATDQQDRDDDE